MIYRSAKIGDELRLDIRALGFWIYGQQEFLDESEKKRHYNEQILQTDHGSLIYTVVAAEWQENVKCFIQDLRRC